MRLEHHTKTGLLEGYSQSLYGFGIANKTRLIYKGAGHIINDTSRLANSCFPRIYMQFQAAISPLTQQITRSEATSLFLKMPTCSDSYTDLTYLSYLYGSVQKKVDMINAQPLTQITKQVCLAKQSLDFTLASAQWIMGKRTNSSMLHNTVNTALSYAPFMLAYTTFGGTLAGQVLSNAALLGCLAYSVRQDYYHSVNPEIRESSPSVALVRDSVIPKVQSLFSKIWK
ncbi:MAG: hypothetical protein S4CHLAM6_10280 [Chlamydiae bacterium]|nr:hypothetical protein [Chlamydiota bacterium]